MQYLLPVLISTFQVALIAVPAFFGLRFIFRGDEASETSYNNSTFKLNGVSFRKYRMFYRILGIILLVVAASIFWYIYLSDSAPKQSDKEKDFWQNLNKEGEGKDILYRTSMLGAIIAIPTRMGSTRFKGKPLADLGGKKVLERVYEKCVACKKADDVYILTDSPEIEDFSKSLGAKYFMTSPECSSGTERIIEVLDSLNSDFIVNVQGDEPFIPSELIDSVIQKYSDTKCDLATAITKIEDSEELFNPNAVKVLRNSKGDAIYFSRSALPYVRGESDASAWMRKSSYWKHIGIYGYTKPALRKYASMPKSVLEQCEMLEQLRFVAAGYKFSLVETDYKVVGIDTPEDLEKAKKLL